MVSVSSLDIQPQNEDRDRRGLNVIIFNLLEGTSKIGIENKDFDEMNTKHIAKEIGVPNIDNQWIML